MLVPIPYTIETVGENELEWNNNDDGHIEAEMTLKRRQTSYLPPLRLD
jgi:hypothetical protein